MVDVYCQAVHQLRDSVSGAIDSLINSDGFQGSDHCLYLCKDLNSIGWDRGAKQLDQETAGVGGINPYVFGCSL